MSVIVVCWTMCPPTQGGGVGMVFHVMQRLVGDAEVQVKGIDMLHALVKEEPQVRMEHIG